MDVKQLGVVTFQQLVQYLRAAPGASAQQMGRTGGMGKCFVHCCAALLSSLVNIFGKQFKFV
jgi:hypothetical protein